MRVLCQTLHRLSDEDFARSVRALLEGLMWAAREEAFVVGPLYGSDVRYVREPRGRETFVTPGVTKKLGGGDCAHLALWRVAELRNSGENAVFAIKIFPAKVPGGRRTFHVRVRRESGVVEDPSAALGMKGLS